MLTSSIRKRCCSPVSNNLIVGQISGVPVLIPKSLRLAPQPDQRRSGGQVPRNGNWESGKSHMTISRLGRTVLYNSLVLSPASYRLFEARLIDVTSERAHGILHGLVRHQLIHG